ncbi:MULTISPECIES: MucBP domain-containing protein [unclassified Enterococcus]|uniref:MucBP domain-containing protein n=1 Tax=unclassified Enterococcus TaxID=2608891 RepID=UPI0024747C61|nr:MULTISPECIES: MucBP domain-containing protein [unclassified Enterococcus]
MKIVGSSLFILMGLAGFGLKAEAATNTKEMYRLYNPNSGEHFYTADTNEKASLISVGWEDEGLGWLAPDKGDEVYRLYNPNAGDHHYTLNEAEKNLLIANGWEDEGLGWYSSVEKELPLYRAYNPNAKTGTHNYTTKEIEQNNLVSVGWEDEGIAWYACGDSDTPYVAKSTVTVGYYDETGNSIKAALVDKQAVDTVSKYTAPKIAGYRVKGADFQNVTFTKRDQTIRFVYEKIDVKLLQVRINYKDIYNKTIKNTDVFKVEENNSYVVKAVNIEGYRLQGEEQRILSNIKSDQSVTFVYEKIE